MAEAEEIPSGGGDEERVKFPVGFRFQPMLQELVEFYLLPKLLDRPTVPNDAVIEADAYECDPEILTKRYEDRGADDSWYFLSPRSRRYPGGDRPTRRTADNRGRWKPSTGQSKPGKDAAAGHSKAKKGLRKGFRVGEFEFTDNTLAYFVGEPTNETKTKWLMLELTVPDPEKQRELDSPTAEKPRDHMLLNKYVMCKIYKSPLKKWKEVENEEGGTSSASACDEEVSTLSQSGPAPEVSGGEASALTPMSSKCAGKRPAAEQPTSEQAHAPNKRASHHTMPPGTPWRPTNPNGGGMRAPPVRVGAAGYYDHHGVPVQLPQLMHWPPAIYSSMQGPVQMQRRRPPLMYAHNGQPPVQGPPATYSSMQGPVQMQRRPPSMYAHNGQPPVSKLYPPHGASATAPNSLGQTVTMRPPNQPVRPPSSFPRPPSQQQQQMEDMMLQQRVYAQLVAEMKLQKALQERAPCAGQQQQIMPTASTQPACSNEGANHPAGTKFMVPRTQFPAPHHNNSNFYHCSGVQQQHQSNPAIPAASVPPGAAAPVEATTPAADDAPGNKLSMRCEEVQAREPGTGTATTT